MITDNKHYRADFRLVEFLVFTSFETEVCAGITCGRDQYCEARNLQPRCVCQRNCPDITISGPVCATNSRDYSDECHLRKARCKRKLNIEVAYRGRCQGKY